MSKKQRPNPRRVHTKLFNFPKSDDRETIDPGLKQMPSIAPAAIWSFLKETKGELSWTTDQMVKTLNISMAEAADVLEILKIQGYVHPYRDDGEWITTSAGEEICGSKMPRYTSESVDQALSELGGRIKKINEDPQGEFRITSAVAFGDFLSKRARVQAADVGISLDERKLRSHQEQSLKGSKFRERFLRGLRGKTQLLKIVRYEPWMIQRTHRKVF